MSMPATNPIEVADLSCGYLTRYNLTYGANSVGSSNQSRRVTAGR